MKKLLILLILVPIFASSVVQASTACNPDRINAGVGRIIKGAKLRDIKQSPIKGLCQAVIGTQVIYVTHDGDYLIAGNILSMKTGKNLTEAARTTTQKAMINDLDESMMIIIGPPRDKARRTLTVFTDVDCPFCAKLHQDVPELIRHGVRVRYLLYPRNGINTPTFKRSVSVWCAKDRIAAIGVAKAGGQLRSSVCDNPVAESYEIGRIFGVTGTPTSYMDSGERIDGYLPLPQMLQALGIPYMSK